MELRYLPVTSEDMGIITFSPADWFRRKGCEDIYDKACLAVNCILITRRTNKAVEAKSPLKYLKELSLISLSKFFQVYFMNFIKDLQKRTTLHVPFLSFFPL